MNTLTTPDFFSNRQGTLETSLGTQSRIKQGTVSTQNALPENSTNLPVPVLADSEGMSTAKNRDVAYLSPNSEARESTNDTYDASSKDKYRDSRGGQNYLSGQSKPKEGFLARVSANGPFPSQDKCGSRRPPAQLFTNQKEGDASCPTVPDSKRDCSAAPSVQPALVAAVDGRSVGRGRGNQGALLDCPKDFDGSTYEPELDRNRLKAQLVRVRECQRDGKWRSLDEIAEITGDPQASISARLRDLRKPRFGLWTVNRRRRSPGTFEYQLGGKGL